MQIMIINFSDLWHRWDAERHIFVSKEAKKTIEKLSRNWFKFYTWSKELPLYIKQLIGEWMQRDIDKIDWELMMGYFLTHKDKILSDLLKHIEEENKLNQKKYDDISLFLNNL